MNEKLALQGEQSRFSGGPFAVINGALAEDAICIYVPEAVELERPIHAIFATSGTSLRLADNSAQSDTEPHICSPVY